MSNCDHNIELLKTDNTLLRWICSMYYSVCPRHIFQYRYRTEKRYWPYKEKGNAQYGINSVTRQFLCLVWWLFLIDSRLGQSTERLGDSRRRRNRSYKSKGNRQKEQEGHNADIYLHVSPPHLHMSLPHLDVSLLHLYMPLTHLSYWHVLTTP
jgi:hypothetical protein